MGRACTIMLPRKMSAGGIGTPSLSVCPPSVARIGECRALDADLRIRATCENDKKTHDTGGERRSGLRLTIRCYPCSFPVTLSNRAHILPQQGSPLPAYSCFGSCLVHFNRASARAIFSVVKHIVRCGMRATEWVGPDTTALLPVHNRSVRISQTIEEGSIVPAGSTQCTLKLLTWLEAENKSARLKASRHSGDCQSWAHSTRLRHRRS